jgi:hypothetical protein
MNKRVAKAYAKFQRLNKLNESANSEDKDLKLAARKTLRRSSDVWTKRNNTNVTGFWRP